MAPLSLGALAAQRRPHVHENMLVSIHHVRGSRQGGHRRSGRYLVGGRVERQARGGEQGQDKASAAEHDESQRHGASARVAVIMGLLATPLLASTHS